MKNVMMIGGHQAVIAYDPDIEMFRGEFLGLNGGADFYADDVAGLHREGEASLAAFIDECARRGIEPRKSFSGKFMLRVESKMHQSGSNRHSSSWGKLESVGGERHPQFISRLMRSNDFRSLVRRRGHANQTFMRFLNGLAWIWRRP